MKSFKLEDGPKIQSGFKIPEDYFENFSSNFIQNLPKEETTKKVKVISIFRKRKSIIMAIAAVLIIALMIPVLYRINPKNNDLDSATIENYLAVESSLNQYELISEIEPENINIENSKNIEDIILEDILATNPNLENLVIEN